MKSEIWISADRESSLYCVDEPVTFTIAVTRNGRPAESGKLRVSVAQDGGPGNTTVRLLDLAACGNPVKVSARMKQPCFCLCQAWYDGSYGEKSVYYRTPDQAAHIFKYNLMPGFPLKASPAGRPDDPPPPADFDEFWAETLRKARQLPDRMELKKLPQYCRPDADYYLFAMNTLNGDRVRGFLGIPKGKGPFPILLLLPGAGPAAVEPIDCGWTAAGCITVMANVHKYPLPATPEESRQQMEEYARSHGVGKYLEAGQEHRETYHMYSILAGYCRLLDHVCTRYPWDGRNLVVSGSSQGGWLTLCMAALYRDKVSAAYAGVPAVGFFSRLPIENPQKRSIPPYYEASYFAPKIKVPILVSAGLHDDCCRAEIISGMFTLIGSRDKTLETDAGEHMGSPLRLDRQRDFLLRALKISSRPVSIPRTDNELIGIRGDMLHLYYLKRFRAIDRRRSSRLAAVKTRKDAEKYSAEVREKLKQVFGPMPPVKPIRPQVTGQLSTKKLKIDKVLFQSRPGYYVSALFYRPANAGKKLPGIVFLCGHSGDGKHSPLYQRVPQSLALRGFGVLAVDPYGQGERSEHGLGAVGEHNWFGQRLALLGEFFGTWRLHDALVALEYLKSRPEIDPARLGATGCSGGGTMTSYLNAFSPDLMMAAPVCSMTCMTSNLENEIYTDCEQNPPGLRAAGLDEDDFLLAYAPRPIMLGVQDNDFFDCRGTRKMYDSMRKIYRICGNPDAVQFSLGKGDHSYSEFHQREIGAFFAALSRAEAVGDDHDIQLFDKKELFCTPDGSVWNLPDARSTRQILAELMKNRNPDLEKYDGRFPANLNPDQIPVPAYRRGMHQYISSVNLQASRFLLRTEPDVEVTLKKISSGIEYNLPSGETAVVFLPENDGIREMDLRDYRRSRENFFILEVRGCGESLPCRPECDLREIFHSLYPACGRLLGKEFLHGQIRDILAAIKLLRKHGVMEITLIAEGAMCVPAAAAAELSQAAIRLEMRNPSISRKKFLLDPKAKLPPPHDLFGH